MSFVTVVVVTYTHFIFDNFFLENRAVYEIMWKNMVEPGTPQMTIRRMRFACWITKERLQTHPQKYVILITFSRQQWLREHASMFRLCIRCFFCHMITYCYYTFTLRC